MADDEFDEDTLSSFNKLLEKLGPSWLEKLKPSLSSPDPSLKTTGSLDLTTFLRETLDKTEKAREKLAEQLETIREVLTPEQLTLLKSLKKGAEGDLQSLPTKENGDGKSETQPAPKRKRFL